MLCPFCCYDKSAVINSRRSVNSQVWRRRQCNGCNKVFTTLESVPLEKYLSIVINKRRVEPYSRLRLQLSLAKACDHIKDKPIDKIEYITSIVEVKMIKKAEEAKLTTKQIKDIVLGVLINFDKVAHIKYDALYVNQ